MDLLVRPETPDDREAIDLVVRNAFGRADEAELVAKLRGHDNVLSFVAVTGDAVVGHAMFSPVGVASSNDSVIASGLAPVAVADWAQRAGVGTALVRFGIDAVRRSGIHILVVLGDPGYYGRFGFVPGRQFGLACKWGGGDDGAFQVLELVSGSAAACRGMVQYLPLFDELE